MFNPMGKHARNEAQHTPQTHTRLKIDQTVNSANSTWDDDEFDYEDDPDYAINPGASNEYDTGDGSEILGSFAAPDHLIESEQEYTASTDVYGEYDTRMPNTREVQVPKERSSFVSNQNGQISFMTSSLEDKKMNSSYAPAAHMLISAQPPNPLQSSQPRQQQWVRRPKPVSIVTVLRALVGRTVVVELLDLPKRQDNPGAAACENSNISSYLTDELAKAQFELQGKYGFSAPTLVVNPQIVNEITNGSDSKSPHVTGSIGGKSMSILGVTNGYSDQRTPCAWQVTEVKGVLDSAQDDHTLTMTDVEIRSIVSTGASNGDLVFGKWLKIQPIRIPGSRVGTIKLPNGLEISKLLMHHQKDLDRLLRQQQRGVRKGPMPNAASVSGEIRELSSNKF